MTNEEFIQQNKTVVDFIQIYCNDNHKNHIKNSNILNLTYNNKNLNKPLSYLLCKECEDLLLYVNQKLQNCPNNPKPKCRKCSHPCYEKEKWKLMAKIMRNSGVKLGFIKLKMHLKPTK